MRHPISIIVLVVILMGAITASTFISMGEVSAPSVSGSGEARFYADSSTHTVRVSSNAGAWSDVATSVSTQFALPVTSGLVFDWRMLACDGSQGSGTTLADCSGNGNTATLHGAGQSVPTWVPTGLSFFGLNTQYIQLDTAVTSTLRTLIIYCDQTPFVNGGYAPLFGSTSASGWHLFETADLVNHSPSIYVSGFITIAAESFAGPGMVAVTLANPDHIYESTPDPSNVNEVAYVGTNGNSVGGVSVGTLQVYGSTGKGMYSTGVVYRVLGYSTVLTPTQIKQTYYALVTDMKRRGIGFSPRNTSSTNKIWFDGDSITAGVGPATPYPNLVTTVDTFTKINYGSGGQKASTMRSRAPQELYPLISSAAARNVVVIMGGTNDLNGGATASAVLADIATLSRGLREQGFQTLVVGQLSRINIDSSISALNTLLQKNWKSFADYYVLPDPLLTGTGAYANATYFQDGTHPTTAGNTILAANVSTAIDRMSLLDASYSEVYFGGTSTTVTVTTAGTYYPFASSTLTVGTQDVIGNAVGSATNNNITIGATGAGDYSVRATCSVAGPNNAIVHAGVRLNGTIVAKCVNQDTMQSTSHITSLSSTCILTLAATDTVDWAVTSDTNSDVVTITHCNLSIIRK